MAERRLVVCGCAAFLASLVCAQDYLPVISVKHPAIQYFEGPLNDPVSNFVKQLDLGTAKLPSPRTAFAYLPILLERFHIPVDSQALVFSQTSFQASKIGPANPRAIYFGDDMAIGYVRGGEGLEVAATDPKQGIVFYAFSTDSNGKPVFTRRDVCLKCHQGPATLGVPGVFIGSVFPSPTGAPNREGAIITDHRTAFEDRWGGWYINARRGEQPDRANAVAENPAEPEFLDTAGKQNLTTLAGKFNPTGYLTPISDIVALMTFEHQTQMINYMTRVGWESRVFEHDGKAAELTGMQLDTDIKALVTYMLFADEVPLKEPIEGVSTFSKTFPQRGPRDHQGRSLRDFDLQKRLFRYPLSYMIYSAQFDALPVGVRDRIYRELYQALTDKKQVSVTAGDRRAIVEILRDTKQGLPEYWR
jgi:hypothetical protein